MVQDYLEENKVKGYHTYSITKAAAAEVTIKNLMQEISRWLTEHNTKSFYKALPEITESINNTISTATGYAPNAVNESNTISIWKHLWGKHIKRMEQPRPPPKFKPGDPVRISKNRLLFTKGTIK